MADHAHTSDHNAAPPESRAEARDHALNPHRDADLAHAAEVAYSQLRQRGVDVTGDEDADALADILESVERFETAVSALGGDRMTNAPDSHDPDDKRLVLPARLDGENAEKYAHRVRSAAQGLMSRVPPGTDLQSVGDAAMGGLAADAQG